MWSAIISTIFSLLRGCIVVVNKNPLLSCICKLVFLLTNHEMVATCSVFYDFFPGLCPCIFTFFGDAYIVQEVICIVQEVILSVVVFPYLQK